METAGKFLAQQALFYSRIYFIFSAVLFYCLYFNVAFCQEIGSYRTIASGNFGNLSIWEIYNGTGWVAATIKPGQGNDIYIDRLTKLTLTGNESVKSVFINAESGSGEKLNLNSFNLDVYGSLQAFSGYAPGVPAGTWNSQNWIGNSITSTITFKGNSRIIIQKNTWSGFTTQSRYTVIFDPGNGNILTIEEPFKAVRFIVRSGTLRQKLDTSVMPNFCSSLSFNTETTFYPSGPLGDFIIESNGKFISECNEKIVARSISGSVSAALFDLQSGAELILEGANPRIEAANFQINGKVTFRGGTSVKSLPKSTFPDAGIIGSFHDLEIQGSQNVQLPTSLNITGSITKIGAGSFLTNSSHLTFIGNHEQTISGFSLAPQDLTVNKSGGRVNLDQSLTVVRNLTMINGILDFQNNHLTINNSGSGNYTYTSGSWENLSSFTYSNTPTNLTISSATFPFGDRYHGGIRKVQMLGTSAGGNLNIQYTEYEGADFNPGFNDSDGIAILYRLFSYFNFSGLNPSSNSLDLKISADKLIVDDPDDLRLVCTGYAAPGIHIPGTDIVDLWAIRSLTFDDLSGKNFTVGSFRTLSILPFTWLSTSAEFKNDAKVISWSVSKGVDNEIFEIYHSVGPSLEWRKIGEVPSNGYSAYPVNYSFVDENSSQADHHYYQIRKVNHSGNGAWSPVFRLKNTQGISVEQLSVYPNPHINGKIKALLPPNFTSANTQVLIYSAQGALISSFKFNEVEFSENLELILPGLYLITFSNSETSVRTRWIKR